MNFSFCNSSDLKPLFLPWGHCQWPQYSIKRLEATWWTGLVQRKKKPAARQGSLAPTVLSLGHEAALQAVVLSGEHRCEMLHQVWRTHRGFSCIHSGTGIGCPWFYSKTCFSLLCAAASVFFWLLCLFNLLLLQSLGCLQQCLTLWLCSSCHSKVLVLFWMSGHQFDICPPHSMAFCSGFEALGTVEVLGLWSQAGYMLCGCSICSWILLWSILYRLSAAQR